MSDIQAIRDKIEETGLLLIAGASLRAVHAEALYGACRTLLSALSAAEARAEAAEAKLAEALLNPDPWRPIEELPEELHGKKIIVCWEASGGWDDHWEIGVKKQRGWVNNYGHPFTGEPTHFREIKGPGQ